MINYNTTDTKTRGTWRGKTRRERAAAPVPEAAPPRGGGGGPLHDGLSLLGQAALTMAMAALGFETRLEKLRALGVSPLILGSILFLLLITGGGAMTALIATI